VPVKLEVPVGVGGEPVVVSAVQNHRIAVRDTFGGQKLFERSLVDEVAADRILQIALPVDTNSAVDVVDVVLRGVLVHLHQYDIRILRVVDDPVCVDKKSVSAHVHPSLRQIGSAYIVSTRFIRALYFRSPYLEDHR
jgi:hypothetical protein